MKINLVTLAWWWFWGWCAGALVFSLFKFLNKQWLPGILLVVIGVSAIVLAAQYPRTLSERAMPLEPATSDDRIVMRMSGESLASWLAYAAAGLIAAVMLVQFPDILWTRWLSYPAAFVGLAVCGLLLGVALNVDLERVVADERGVEVRSRGRDDPTTEKVSWQQVGAVKRIKVYIKKVRGTDDLSRREFVLLDRGGVELLNLEEPLDPPDNYGRFLESIPRWTGLPVQETSVRR